MPAGPRVWSALVLAAWSAGAAGARAEPAGFHARLAPDLAEERLAAVDSELTTAGEHAPNLVLSPWAKTAPRPHLEVGARLPLALFRLPADRHGPDARFVAGTGAAQIAGGFTAGSLASQGWRARLGTTVLLPTSWFTEEGAHVERRRMQGFALHPYRFAPRVQGAWLQATGALRIARAAVQGHGGALFVLDEGEVQLDILQAALGVWVPLGARAALAAEASLLALPPRWPVVREPRSTARAGAAGLDLGTERLTWRFRLGSASALDWRGEGLARLPWSVGVDAIARL